MKKVFVYALIFTATSFACSSPNSSKEDSQEEVVKEENKPTGMFGAEIDDKGLVSLDQLVATLESQDEFEGKVVGEIKEVCSMKGCWMTIDLPNGQTMRVTFKDYGFFVPKNSHGYPVIIEGIASKKVTDVATLKHYAEDAGKSQEEIDAITEPKQEYAFEAVGVIIRDNA